MKTPALAATITMCKPKLGPLVVLVLLLKSPAWADDPVQVAVTTTPEVTGPFGCPLQTSPTVVNIRVQSLKTSSGLVFHRKTLSEDMFACFEAGGYQSLSASHINDCAEATEDAGLQMYRWHDESCTGYAIGIPDGLTCKMNEAVVLYSMEGVVDGPNNFILTLHHSVSSIWAEWQMCIPESPSKAAKFQLSWNSVNIPLDGMTFEYRLQHIDLCTDDLTQVNPALLEVTLEAFDDSDIQLMDPVTKTLTAIATTGARHKLRSGNCLYYEDDNSATYDNLMIRCRDVLFGTMFIEYEDGDFTTYRDDLMALSDNRPAVYVDFHYVGLRSEDGEFKWLSGRVQNNDESLWFDYNTNKECVEALADDAFRLDATECGYDETYVCHEML